MNGELDAWPNHRLSRARRGEPLVGTEESDQLDFKLAPYVPDAPHQKWELAKDVAAFANRRGGVIVIGVHTERRPNKIIELAGEIRPVRKAVVVTCPPHRGRARAISRSSRRVFIPSTK